MTLRRLLGAMASSVPFGLVIDAPESIQAGIDGWPAVHIPTHHMRGLVVTGASNVPIDRLGIARFGAP
jgi:hypothetical protein